MLNYGESHILELMKNTLPRRLYLILFPIDNLRDAIKTAKWVMIKEKKDRQKTGQLLVTPFMEVNECGQTTDRSSKRGVTIDVMKTLERYSDSIDKVPSLVRKMNVQMDKKETPYKPRVYQNRPRGQSRGRQQYFQPCNRSLSRGRNRTRGIIIITIEIIDPTLEIDPGTIIDVTIEEITTIPMRDIITIDRTIGGEMATDKTIEIDKIIGEMTPEKETGAKVGIDQEIIVMTAPEVETGTETEMDRCNLDPELCLMTEEDQGPDLIQE